MFQLTQIKDAHSKVKSGADFPNYIQDLIKLGVKRYDTYVSDGHTQYFGSNSYQIQTEPKYSELTVSDISDKIQFKSYLENHQMGQTDYPTFCKHSALTGVYRWTVDIEEMTCTYYDKFNNVILEERILTP